MNNIYNDMDVESKLIYGVPAEDNDLCIMVPYYKRLDLLKKALNSLLSQIEPERLKYQIYIVVNDPCFKSDDIADLCLSEKKFCIFVNEKNLGMVGNINRCIFLSKGRFVAYLHDDDLLLDNYLIEIEKLFLDGSLEGIDCLIPNSYYYYDSNNDGVFGKKAIKRTKLKDAMCSIVCLGKRKQKMQRLCSDDCVKAWSNGGSGGPTCGIIFKRDALIQTNGFDIAYPYAFDTLFMIDYMSKHKVMRMDKYLAIYRMTESASNGAKVQESWLEGDKYMIERFSNIPYIEKNKNEIWRLCIESKCKEVQDAHKGEYAIHNFKFLVYRIRRLLFMMRKGLYQKRTMPNKYQGLL